MDKRVCNWQMLLVGDDKTEYKNASVIKKAQFWKYPLHSSVEFGRKDKAR